MSRVEPKAGEWLRQQIEELGALRNASVRDPQFKAWRQNTLTFIQRIWEGDANKSERFRRIPFSPASTRADARAIREQFERGCGEALEYLNTLLVQLGEERVAPGTTRSVSRETERFEGDFPVVELGGETGAGAASAEAAVDLSDGVIGDGPNLDLPLPEDAGPPAPRSTGPSRLPNSAIRPVAPEGLPEGFAGATPLDLPGAPANEPPPAAPSLGSRISVRGTPPPAGAARDARANPLKDILAPQRKEAAARGRTGKNGRGRKGGKAKLKDMLGFSQYEGAGASTPAPPAARPAEAAPPSPPASPPVAEEPVAAAAEWTMPDFLAPAEPLLPLTEDDVEPALPAAADPALPAGAEPARPQEPEEADPFAIEPEPAAEAAAEAADALDTARVMEDFLLNSPVMRARPRPVPRRGAAAPAGNTEPLPSRDTAASRMLAIAAEVNTLGVPEGHRARVRAALMDLARQLDEPELSWEVLRDAVQFVMEFPPIARRALPLLLPFLDLAA